MVDGKEGQLVVIGSRCTLFDDPERSLAVRSGQLLIPWCGDRSLMIDRFDGRGYLTDLPDANNNVTHDYKSFLSEEEITIEKMCEFERYLELQMDIHEAAVRSEEEQKRCAEKDRSQYAAVNFNYAKEPEASTNNCENEEKLEDQVDEPYVCPSELQSLMHLCLPQTQKQAQIIERTAVFVARQGNQMEIVLKAKQKNNKSFDFLNYDNDLNPFYKQVVKLISQGRYIPKARPIPEIKMFNSSSVEESKESVDNDTYELKLPKVDISNTAYAALISKFKKVNELNNLAMKANQESAAKLLDSVDAKHNQSESSPSSVHETMNGKIDSENSASEAACDINTTDNENAVNTTAANATTTTTTTTTDAINTDCCNNGVTEKLYLDKYQSDYEHYYQEYYKHYYTHYYAYYSQQRGNLTDADCSLIVQEAAKAAATAAASAVNLVNQTVVNQTPIIPVRTMSNEERAIIDKMAEYVVRNGLEFEELVSRSKSKDSRFGFLRPEHPLHSYYMSKRRELDPDDSRTRAADAGFPSSPVRSVTNSNCTRDSNTKHSPDNICSSLINNYDSSDSDSDSNDSKEEKKETNVSFRLSNCTNSKKTKTTVSAQDQLEKTEVNSSKGSVSDTESVSGSSSTSNRTEKMTPIHDDDDHTTKHRSIIPGIPSCSSSSSSGTSSPCLSPVHNCQSPELPDNDNTEELLHSSESEETDAWSDTENKFSDSVVTAVDKLNHSPNMLVQLDSPIEKPVGNNDDRSVAPWGRCNIEDLLDIHEPTSILDLSTDGYHTSVDTPKDERLKEERRKKAAQLVNQLKLSSALVKSISSSETTAVSEQREEESSSVPKFKSRKYSPPPAPSSVPAAVAHAVVVKLKRREEETLVKAKKRTKSPPVAYSSVCNWDRENSSRKRKSHREKLEDDLSQESLKSSHKKRHL